VTSCSSCAEAVVQISSSSSSAFDILLADKGAVGCAAVAAAGSGRSGLLDSCKGLPCILMGESPSPTEVMQSISLGAVDFLAKPVSQLKLRNIWQHTVRKMMADMQICTSKKPQAAAKAPLPAAPAPAHLDRSASNAPDMAAAAAGAPSAPAVAAPPPKPPSGLPPRSPPLRAVRASHRLHACVSSTNLAAGGPGALASADDDAEFDFDAAAAAAGAAPADGEEPAAAPAPSASGATATATATHVSVPAPSCGMPVAGALAPLAAGMVWGMPMPVVRAPGIVPPNCPAAPPPQQPQPAAGPWGYMAGCAMPPMAYMAPPYMMMPPHHGMYGSTPCYGPPGYPSAAPQPPCSGYAAAAAPLPPPRAAAAPTGAAAAKALDASLMSFLGSAEDDGDLEVDIDDFVLQDLHGAAAAGKPPQGAAPAPAGSPSSLGSSHDALPRVESAGLLAGAGFGPDDDADAFLEPCGAAAADWGDALALKKSASLADLLAGPLAVA
jgi:hypothetical protein